MKPMRTSTLVKLGLITLAVTLLFCKSAFAYNLCPATNQIPDHQPFWVCATVGACNGTASFIGAYSMPTPNGELKYFCAYNTDIQASLISVNTFAKPIKFTLRGHWQWWDAGNRFKCQANNPGDCPIPAGFSGISNFADKFSNLLKPALIILIEVMLGGLLIVSILRFKKAKATKLWPTVAGVITRSQLIKEIQRNNFQSAAASLSLRFNYTLDIIYQYEVAGKQYQSKQVYISLLGGREVLTEKVANMYLEKFPKDKKVPVFYKRNNPQEAVIEPQHKYGMKMFIIIGILAFLFANLTQVIFSYLFF